MKFFLKLFLIVYNGKIKIGKVLVPDFSSDEKGFTRLKEEFDILKEFILEKEFLKKGDIAKGICKNEFSCITRDSSKTFTEFVLFLNENMQARLVETGLSLNFEICYNFAYGGVFAQLSSGVILYNDIPIVQPLSWAGGFYLYCFLQYALNPEEFCPQHHQDLKEKVLDSKLPTHNYLSWAFYLASIDNEYIEFASEVKKSGY